MHFQEHDVGPYRIYVGAIEARRGGYEACVVVHLLRAPALPPTVVFRDERLAGAHNFPTAADALRHALAVGKKAVSNELTCQRFTAETPAT